VTVREDADEFRSTGLQGTVRQMIASSDEGYVRIVADGWRGEIMAQRPEPGTGPFIHYRRGQPLLRYRNATAADTNVEEYRLT
jgi:hypothetical protein